MSRWTQVDDVNGPQNELLRQRKMVVAISVRFVGLPWAPPLCGVNSIRRSFSLSLSDKHGTMTETDKIEMWHLMAFCLPTTRMFDGEILIEQCAMVHICWQEPSGTECFQSVNSLDVRHTYPADEVIPQFVKWLTLGECHLLPGLRITLLLWHFL